jgi:hypothetical protein
MRWWGIINLLSNLKLKKMKKFMFSSIATIAFVGSSMAADVATVEKDLLKVKDTKIELQRSNLVAFIWFTKCDIIYIQTYSIAFAQFNNVDAANAIAMSAAATCADLVAAPKK